MRDASVPKRCGSLSRRRGQPGYVRRRSERSDGCVRPVLRVRRTRRRQGCASHASLRLCPCASASTQPRRSGPRSLEGSSLAPRQTTPGRCSSPMASYTERGSVTHGRSVACRQKASTASTSTTSRRSASRQAAANVAPRRSTRSTRRTPCAIWRVGKGHSCPPIGATACRDHRASIDEVLCGREANDKQGRVCRSPEAPQRCGVVPRLCNVGSTGNARVWKVVACVSSHCEASIGRACCRH